MKNNLLTICKNFFKNTDGRIIVCLAVILYYAVFFAGLYLFDKNLMKLQGIPVLSPSFLDLRSVASGMDAIRAGYDPLVKNPYDPLGRTLNYPRIWHLLANLNIKASDTVPLGIGIAVIFYLFVVTIIMPKINSRNAVLWVFLILSPAATLAIERGNNDLIVFILLCLALAGFKTNGKIMNYCSYMLILLTAFLKLFPIFAFWSLFKEKRKTFWILSIFFSIMFLLYIGYSYNDLKLINSTTFKSIKSSYGNIVFFHYIQRYILDEMLNMQPFPGTNLVAWVFTLLFIVLTFWYFGKKLNPALYSDRSYITSFRIGAAIFVGSFLLGNNFDYRFIFLLFTVPQLSKWNLKGTKNLARYALWVTLISMWSITWLSILKLPYNLGIIFDEIFNWLLFGVMLYLLIITSTGFFENMFTPKPVPSDSRSPLRKYSLRNLSKRR
jgi:hypothetical protein